MAKTHDGPHDGEHPHPGCFGCKVKGGFSLSMKATPSRTPSKALPRTPDPAWERGIAGEHRPDGSFMPWLTPGTTTPMGVKEASERRHQLDATRRRNHGST